jgi:hypothetical protein
MKSIVRSGVMSVWLALFAGIGQAWAAPIIDFEGVTPDDSFTGDNVTPYVEDGFTLTSSGSPLEYHNDIFNNFAETNGNGNTTSIFGWCGFCDGAPFVFTLTGPGPFALVSIDFGGLETGVTPASAITVTGFFAGGGTISQTVDPTAAFSTFNFPGFTNLSSLQFGLQTPGNNSAADNIVVAPTAVPEPVSFVLLGTGLIAAGLRRYRRRQ